MTKRLAAVNNLVFNYATVAFNAISGFVLVPLYLRHFDMATYGLWLGCANTVGLLGLVEGGFNLVFAQRLATTIGKGHKKEFAELVGAGLVVAVAQALVTLAGGIVLAGSIAVWLGANLGQQHGLAAGVLFATIGASASIGYFTLGAIIQAWQRTFWAGLVNVVALVVGVMTNVAALWYGYGVMSIGLGLMARGAVSCLGLAMIVMAQWRQGGFPVPTWNRSRVRSLVNATLPVAVGQGATTILGNSQAAIVTVLISPAAAATLSIFGRLYEVCKLFMAPVGGSVFSGLAQVVGTGDTDKLRRVATEVVGLFSAAAGLTLGMALALNETFVRNWVGASAVGNHPLSIALCVAAALSSIVLLLRFMLTAFGEIGRTARLSVIELVVRLPSIVVMVHWFGLIGVPLGEVVSTGGVSGWAFGRLWARTLDLHGRDRGRVAAEALLPVMVGVLFGTLWSSVAAGRGGWTSAAFQGIGGGAMLAVLMIWLSAPARQGLRDLRRR